MSEKVRDTLPSHNSLGIPRRANRLLATVSMMGVLSAVAPAPAAEYNPHRSADYTAAGPEHRHTSSAGDDSEPMIGVVENNVLTSDPVLAYTRVNTIKLIGANTLRLNVILGPHGKRHPSPETMNELYTVEGATALAGIRLLLSFYPKPGELTSKGKATPLTSSQQREFCDSTDKVFRELQSVEDVQIGNEPNSSLFWEPQYGSDGKSRAPEAYVGLLARCYDTLMKTAAEQNRELRIYAPALASKGNGDPHHPRPSHPPKDFILKMGDAYRDSGRTKPIFHRFTLHPYEESNASSPKREVRKNSTTVGFADYPILRQTIKTAFEGTGQPWNVDILWDEFGVQTDTPPNKISLYRGGENVTTVDPATQVLYLRQGFEMAYCQGARGVFTFLARDERDLDRWQSGVLYADGSAKSSLPGVQDITSDVKNDNVDCSKY